MMKGPVETIESNEYVRTPSSGGGGEGGNRRNVDFSEFMWMADEELEDFDRRYYEELLIEECIKDCSDDLSDSGVVCFVSPPTQPTPPSPQSSQQQWQQPSSQQQFSVVDGMQSLNMNSSAENSSSSHSSHNGQQGSLPAQVVMSSKLNPNAPVFIPRTAGSKTSETDEAGLR